MEKIHTLADMMLNLFITTTTTATKSSASDAGTQDQTAWDNDFVYICTHTGTAGNAVWKKFKIVLT
jgi:hypothetical protein